MYGDSINYVWWPGLAWDKASIYKPPAKVNYNHLYYYFKYFL